MDNHLRKVYLRKGARCSCRESPRNFDACSALSHLRNGNPAQGKSCARARPSAGNHRAWAEGPLEFFERKEFGFSTGNAGPEGAALYTRGVVYVVCARSFVASELLV